MTVTTAHVRLDGVGHGSILRVRMIWQPKAPQEMPTVHRTSNPELKPHTLHKVPSFKFLTFESISEDRRAWKKN